MKLKTILLDNYNGNVFGFLTNVYKNSFIVIDEDDERNYKILIIPFNVQIIISRETKILEKINNILDLGDRDLLLRKYMFSIINEHLDVFELFEEVKEDSIEIGKDLKIFEMRKVLKLQ